MSRPWPPIQRLHVRATDLVVFPAGSTYGPRVVNEFEFVWIIEGGGMIHYDQQPVQALPGTILLCRPGMTDRYDWGEKERTLHAFFHFDCDVPQGWPALTEWPLARPMPPDDVLRPLFRYVLGAESVSEPMRSTLLLPCVDFMLRSFISGNLTIASEPHAKLPPPVEKALRTICERVLQNPEPPITLAQLAATAHVSCEHLCRLFRQALNLTPLDCVRLARLERAASLLWRSDLSIGQVSESVGFSSQFYFARAFQKVYGQSASSYRKSRREGEPTVYNPIIRFWQTGIPKGSA